MDEEGEIQSCINPVNTPDHLYFFFVAAAKHAAFVKARGRHYSNEAEAMKVCTLCHSLHSGQF